MRVPKNRFAAKSPEAKRNTLKGLSTPPGFKPGECGNPNAAVLIARKKLFTDYLNEFYAADPRKLQALIARAHMYAMQGHARFLELILDRLEGPVRRDAPSGGNHLHLHLSDSEKSEARESILRIASMGVIDVTPQEKQEKEEANAGNQD